MHFYPVSNLTWERTELLVLEYKSLKSSKAVNILQVVKKLWEVGIIHQGLGLWE